MMTARDDTSTRPANSTSWRCCWPARHSASPAARNAPKAITTTPAESTVTDAQSQGSGAGYRTVLRAPSQVQIALKPDAPARPRASRPRPRKAYHRGRPARARRRRQRRRLGRRCLGRGARAGPAGIHAQRRRAQPRAATADLHGYAACFSPAMQCTAQRVTLTLAPTAAGAAASPTWKATPSRARRWSSKAAGTPPTNARRA